ncbi:MAG: DUF2156 domain-containing protein [Bacillota bacterium]|jgi:hypothetical protein
MLEFKAVELEDRALLKSFLEKIPPYFTEHSFTTLFAWQRSYSFEFALSGAFLFLKNTFQGVTSFFPPFAKSGQAEPAEYRRALTEIVEYCRTMNLPCILSEVGDNELSLIQAAMPDEFAVRKDRGNANYIYRVDDLTKLEGKKYHSQRNHLNSFKRNYPFYKFLPITEDLIPACRETLGRWTAENRKTNIATVQQEAEAIDRLFENMAELELRGVCIMIGGKVEAFAIGEQISEDTAAIIIEKANAEYKGLYAAVNQMFLESDWQDCTYVNRAEDMGLANLRRTKLGYFPCKLAMKYILTCK